ncbi:galactosylceramide sulfotransferase-like [Branchiostoma lanceolatum]|uniref:galactosylceramide sulfotransferase-like n=1 Tax=Branchiostoma lanceolatum TaxID=7740 RepID=UPI0034554DDE
MQMSQLQVVFILLIVAGAAVYHVQDSVFLKMYPVARAQLGHHLGLRSDQVEIDIRNTNDTLAAPHEHLDFDSEVPESINRNNLSSHTQSPDNGTCQPHLNVAFLKVHKCGSSLLSHMFLRFGYENRLLTALPRRKGGSIIGSMGKIGDGSYLNTPGGKRWNIFAHHAMYNRTRFRQLMAADARYVTILREPLQRLQSSFKYFDLGLRFSGLKEKTPRGTPYVTTYLKNATYWDPKYKVPKSLKHREHYCFRNCMARDLGLQEHEYENHTAVQEFVRGIENDFSTVLILEHLPASLVLLKRRMCWTLYNILYTMGVHTRRQRYKREAPITDAMKRAFYKHNYADVMLYTRFNDSFHKQISQEGADFFEEVKHFVQVNHAVMRYCKSGKRKQGKMTVKASRWDEAFSVDQTLCSLYGKKRPYFDKLLRRAYRQKSV